MRIILREVRPIDRPRKPERIISGAMTLGLGLLEEGKFGAEARVVRLVDRQLGPVVFKAPIDLSSPKESYEFPWTAQLSSGPYLVTLRANHHGTLEEFDDFRFQKVSVELKEPKSILKSLGPGQLHAPNVVPFRTEIDQVGPTLSESGLSGPTLDPETNRLIQEILRKQKHNQTLQRKVERLRRSLKQDRITVESLPEEMEIIITSSSGPLPIHKGDPLGYGTKLIQRAEEERRRNVVLKIEEERLNKALRKARIAARQPPEEAEDTDTSFPASRSEPIRTASVPSYDPTTITLIKQFVEEKNRNFALQGEVDRLRKDLQQAGIDLTPPSEETEEIVIPSSTLNVTDFRMGSGFGRGPTSEKLKKLIEKTRNNNLALQKDAERLREALQRAKTAKAKVALSRPREEISRAPSISLEAEPE
jgi:regulator of replication initiation timing